MSVMFVFPPCFKNQHIRTCNNCRAYSIYLCCVVIENSKSFYDLLRMYNFKINTNYVYQLMYQCIQG